MKLYDLEIDTFGAWRKLQLAALSDKLTVFYGANEAGKTTLLQFVRAILYGFGPERRRRYLPPDGSVAGGRLTILGPGGQYRLSREGDAAGDDRLLVYSPTGEALGHEELQSLLGGVDEPIFNNVFAIGLRELQELGTLGDTEAAGWLYNLASGFDRVSLIDVIEQVEVSRNRLLARDDRPSQIVQLYAQRARLTAEIEELGNQIDAWVALETERRDLEFRIHRSEETITDLERRVELFDTAVRVQPLWQQRLEIDQQLAVLPPTVPLPDQALEMLDRLNLAVRKRRRKHRRHRDELVRLGQEARAIEVDELLLRHAPRIEALDEQQPWFLSLIEQVRDLEAEVAALETQCQQDSERLAIQAGDMVSTAITEDVWQGLKRPARNLKLSRQKVAQAEAQLRQSRANKTQVDTDLSAALAAASQDNLTVALEQAGNRVAFLRRRLQVDERLDQLQRNRSGLEAESEELLKRQLLPVWILGALGGAIVLAMMITVGGWLWDSASIKTLGILIGGIAVCAGGVKFFLEKSAANQLDSCRSQLDLIARQLQEITQERDELDAELPAGGGPLTIRLQEAEKQLALLEELIPLDTQRQSSRHEVGAAEAALARAQVEHQAAGEAWQAALERAGLPEGLAPSDLKRISGGNEQSYDTERRLDRRREELSHRRREYALLAARVNHLVADLEPEPVVDSPAAKKATTKDPGNKNPLDQIRQLVTRLNSEQTLAKRRQQLYTQRRAVAKKRRACARSTAALRRRRSALFRRAGVDDESLFRARAGQRAQRIALEQKHETLCREITLSLRGRTTEPQLAEVLRGESADQLLRSWEQLDEQLKAERAQLARSHQRLGDAGRQQQVLTADRRLAEWQLELSQVEAQLRAAIEAWQVRAVTGLFLERVRQEFERHRQPETLLEASGYLETLTDGHYRRIWTPLGRNLLYVDDSSGQTWPVEVLSRGTREQLFLSLRLALVSLYARRGVHLPVVLDDVLVNFDAQRTKAAVTLMRDFTKAGHQLLVFTCHEHVWKMFKTLKLDARRLPTTPTSIPEPKPSRAPRTPRPRAAAKKQPPAEPVKAVEPPPPPPPAPEVKEVPVRQLPPPPAPIEIPPVRPVAPPPEPDYELEAYDPVPVPELEWGLDPVPPVEPAPPEPPALETEVVTSEPEPPVVEVPAEPEVPQEDSDKPVGARGWEVEFEEEWTVDETEAA